MPEKFLIISSYAESLVNFRRELLEAIIKCGLEVHVAAPNLSQSTTKDTLESLGIIVHEIPLKRTGLNPFVDIKTIFYLWRLMVKLSPNYMLAYTIKPVIYGTISAYFAKVPRRFALITGLGYTFIEGNNRSYLLKYLVQLLYKFSLSMVETVFFQNSDDESLFYSLNLLNKMEPKSVVINGSGINLKIFRPASFPTKLRFLLIGRLLGDKGVREYIKAAEIVRLKYPQVEFDLVGWIDENPDAINVQELNSWIENNIINFHGRVQNVMPVIANSSVYVLPSYREGTPRTVLEAMAMGRPIITTNAPGCRQTVNEGENGFLVKVKSVTGLADAMMKFIERPDLIAQMGFRSRQKAEDMYDVNLVNQKMLKQMGLM